MKRILALVLTLAMLLVLAAGCANETPTQGSVPSEPSETPSMAPSEETPQTRVILDSKGREVEIPDKVERIVCVRNHYTEGLL